MVRLVGSVWVLHSSPAAGQSFSIPAEPSLVGGAGSATVVAVDGAPSATVTKNAKRLKIMSKAAGR